MTTGHLSHVRLALILVVSLFMPLLLAYSLYVDLSGTVLLSSDMSFEDPEDEDLSPCQNEFKGFMPTGPFNPLLPAARFGRGSNLLPFLLTSNTQIESVLRC